MLNFESMYYNLIGKLADLQEFLESSADAEGMVSDTHQLIVNIIEESDEKYITAGEKQCVMC